MESDVPAIYQSEVDEALQMNNVEVDQIGELLAMQVDPRWASADWEGEAFDVDAFDIDPLE